MKRINTIVLTLMLGASSVLAQPGSVQKVAKSVFTLTTFNKGGAIISSTQGVFIDNKGTAISTFKPFVGATKASVVDATGKSYEVDAIMGPTSFMMLPNSESRQILQQLLSLPRRLKPDRKYGSFPTLSRNRLSSRKASRV